jgi:hypothetical protein
LPPLAFSYFDIIPHNWYGAPEEFAILISGSCTHTIRSKALFLGFGEEKRLTDDRFPRTAR